MTAYLVKVPGRDRRPYVKLVVSTHRFRTTSINTRFAGPAMFRGYWYGNDPQKIDSYGKILGAQRGGKAVPHRVIGKVRNHWAAKRLLG